MPRHDVINGQVRAMTLRDGVFINTHVILPAGAEYIENSSICYLELQLDAEVRGCNLFRSVYRTNNVDSSKRQFKMYTVSQKTVQTYFFVRTLPNFDDCKNFWHQDIRENKLF